MVAMIYQEGSQDCGLACLNMIFSAYNYKAKLPLKSKALSLLDIRQLCHLHGFNFEAYWVEAKGLKEFGCPIILYWNNQHFVVLVKQTSKYFYVHDPAFGSIKLKYIDFVRFYSGVAVQIKHPKAICPVFASKTNQKILVWCVQSIRHNLNFLTKFIFLSVLITVVLSPLILSQLYVQLKTRGGISSGPAFQIGLFFIISNLLIGFDRCLQLKIRKSWANNLFIHLFISARDFNISRREGCFEAFKKIHLMLFEYLIGFLKNSFVTITCCVIFFIINYKLAFIVLLVLFVQLLFFSKFDSLIHYYRHSADTLMDIIKVKVMRSIAHLDSNELGALFELASRFSERATRLSFLYDSISRVLIEFSGLLFLANLASLYASYSSISLLLCCVLLYRQLFLRAFNSALQCISSLKQLTKSIWRIQQYS